MIMGLVLLNSCKPPRESYNHVSYIIKNTSGHIVSMEIYQHEVTEDTIIIQKSDSIVSEMVLEGHTGNPPPFLSDSVKVTYSDTTTIVHYRTAEQIAKRSILLDDSWTGTQIELYQYEWKYVFTEEDYLEALEKSK